MEVSSSQQIRLIFHKGEFQNSHKVRDIFSLSLAKLYATMLTINTILKELKDVPVDRLEELYQFVHSLTPKAKQTENLRKKIISFSGAFSDMSDKDYSDFLNQTKKTRAKLFDRKIKL